MPYKHRESINEVAAGKLMAWTSCPGKVCNWLGIIVARDSHISSLLQATAAVSLRSTHDPKIRAWPRPNPLSALKVSSIVY